MFELAQNSQRPKSGHLKFYGLITFLSACLKHHSKYPVLIDGILQAEIKTNLVLSYTNTKIDLLSKRNLMRISSIHFNIDINPFFGPCLKFGQAIVDANFW
jgi:hypothetical protein